MLAGQDGLLAEKAQAMATAQPVFRFKPYPGRASAYVVDTVQTVLHLSLIHI